MMVLGAISGVISNWPSLPPYKVSNMLHYILGWFKVALGWLVGAYPNHSIHKAKDVGPQSTWRVGYEHKGGQF